MGNKNTIELNGKQYDAVSGALLGVATIPHTVSAKSAHSKIRTSRTIDGFTHAPKKTSPAAQKVSVREAAPKPITPRKIVVKHVTRQQENAIKHHKTQSSQTLMRTAVKKPSDSLKKHINIQSEIAHKTPAVIVPKTSVYSLSARRLERAKSIALSPHISRFSRDHHVIKPSFAAFGVRPAPTGPAHPDAGAPKPQLDNKPKTIDLFESAMANANHYVDTQANKLHFKKKARRHVASMSAGALALVVLGSFLAYQNVPGVQLKIASFQAGFSTHMPNFKAAGFAYNGVRHQNGQLTIGFSGASGKYQLVQQQTNWSGNEMIQHFSSTDASGTPNYSAIEVDGATVYRLANNSATWVSGGKWYQVNGTAALSDYQLKNLVTNI